MIQSPNILLIDDDSQLRSVLRRALVRGGYLVHEADNGREALEVLSQTSVSLVITDIIMPDMDGLELILAINRTNPKIRLVAMSAGGRISPDDYLQIAKLSGATRTIRKPFSIAALLDLVKEVIDLPDADSTYQGPEI